MLTDTLLVQTDSKNWEQAVECSNRPGGGLVLTGGHDMLGHVEHVLRSDSYPRPILVDRALYTGKARKLAKDPFDREWINRQRRLPMAAVVPDAGYVGDGDVDGLKTILTSVDQLGAKIDQDVIALLPLHLSWLDTDRGLDTLLDEVSRAAVPIAIALEHEGDPLSVDSAVDGLVTLLASPAPVIVLRCDISALGALSYGALAAAVGTSTNLRHIYPSEPRGGFVPRPQIAAIVKACLAHLSLNKIDQAIQTDPDHPLWRCECDYCAGRSLDWIRSSSDPKTFAYLHSLETLYHIRRDIIGRNATSLERQQSWASQCSHALFVHRSIAAGVRNWTPPKALEHWERCITQSPNRQPNRDRGSAGRPAPPPTD